MGKSSDPLFNLAQSYCDSQAKGLGIPATKDILAAITIGIALTLEDPEVTRNLLLRTMAFNYLPAAAAVAKIKSMGRTALLTALAKEA